jgi:carbamoyl-phosphate synthase large subunit
MKSTGEVMGISKTMGESFLRASISAGNNLPKNGKVFISVNDGDKKAMIPIAKKLNDMGFTIIATAGTSILLNENGMNTERIYKVGEGRPNVVDGIKNGEINLVINTPLGAQSRFDEEAIGKACIKKGILAITTLSGANAAVDAVSHKDDYSVKSIQDYHN